MLGAWAGLHPRSASLPSPGGPAAGAADPRALGILEKLLIGRLCILDPQQRGPVLVHEGSVGTFGKYPNATAFLLGQKGTASSLSILTTSDPIFLLLSIPSDSSWILQQPLHLGSYYRNWGQGVTTETYFSFTF